MRTVWILCVSVPAGQVMSRQPHTRATILLAQLLQELRRRLTCRSISSVYFASAHDSSFQSLSATGTYRSRCPTPMWPPGCHMGAEPRSAQRGCNTEPGISSQDTERCDDRVARESASTGLGLAQATSVIGGLHLHRQVA